ncbi:hypothetical protein DH2020_048605 [Rehmannia glutinosa]|uniref:C2 domain-containing protein n=1 Tax=Rehmannia glutinosa TaxID=99300 RepID=A0ABR0U552_REHGL
MASRYEVEITIISAKDLKNVNWRHGKLRPYAVVWIDPNKKCSTRADEERDASPYWDEKLLIPFNSPIEDSILHIDVVHAKTAAEDTKPLIGSARVPLDDVGLGSTADRKIDLKRPSGRPHGKLDVRISVREPRYRAPDPYYAPPYGVPHAAYGSPYGAPPAYGAPPPSGYPGYGAPPPPYGQAPLYGQPSYGAAEEKKKSKFGGMGTGLAVGAVAGALGGLAVAEGFDALENKIADDAADRVEDDLGYDGDDY